MKPTKAVAFMSRPRRGVPETQSVTVARATSESPDESKKSIRLTVKMPSSKLREATSGSRRNVAVNSRDAFEGVEIMSGPRGSRAKRTIVEESESEEEEEEESAASDDEQQDEDDEEQDDDGEEEDEDEEAEEDSADADADADGDADVDADGDIVMDDEASLPPPPVIKLTGSASKPSLTVTPAQESKVKSVEAKEMELADDDDEELSELDSEAEAEEGENAENEEAAEIDEMDQDDESRSVGTGSRASTPDVSKMTKRQRSRLDQVMGSDFLQLPMEPQIKKHLTAEEHAMRRAEMARRRKNLSEKRNEEEKMDTINRLLKKQAPKRRGKISAAELSAAAAGVPLSASALKGKSHNASNDDALSRDEEMTANPVFTRWVSDRSGCRVGVPGEWLGKGVRVGAVFGAVAEVEG